MFNLEDEKGLTSLLSEETLNARKVMQFDSTSNLHFLPTGPLPSNLSELLTSTQMQLNEAI